MLPETRQSKFFVEGSNSVETFGVGGQGKVEFCNEDRIGDLLVFAQCSGQYAGNVKCFETCLSA